MDIATRIRHGLVNRGLPVHVADGFLMNMRDESGLNPGINEAAPLVPGSRGGFGLYQLTGPRRTGYEVFADQRGVPYDDIDAQLDWLVYELQGPESAAAKRIYETSTPGEAAAAIVNSFLRPAEEHRRTRSERYLGEGNNAFDAFASYEPVNAFAQYREQEQEQQQPQRPQIGRYLDPRAFMQQPQQNALAAFDTRNPYTGV